MSDDKHDLDQIEELGVKILNLCTDVPSAIAISTLARLLAYILSEQEIDYVERMALLNMLFNDIATEFTCRLH